jgi:sec-independent protein translocase protein TatC
MASEGEEPRTEVENEEGGPVKTFLEHLEDLRWVLIKCLAALFVTVLFCLLAGPLVMTVMMRPLGHAKAVYAKNVQHVSLYFLGTNRLGTFRLDEQQKQVFPISSNRLVVLQIEPVMQDTNTGAWLLGLRQDTNQATLAMADRLNIPLVNLSPVGGFIVAFKVAIYAGIVLAAPFIIYFVAAFVFPALRMREKKYVYGGMLWGFGLFMTGVTFCYFVLLPVALTASVQYSEWLGFSAPQWRAEDYVGFVSKFMLGMGVGFELPVVILVLARLGIVNYKMLSKARRYVIVINFVLGAVLTTPEVITQVLMAVPLQILYEITVWIVWWQEKQQKKREALEEAQEASGTPAS